VRKGCWKLMRKNVPVCGAALLAIVIALMGGASGGLAYEERDVEPKVDYPSLLAARDSIGAMINRVVRDIGGPAHKAIHVSRGPTRFKYWYAGDSADGWAFRIVVSDTSECPNTRLQYALDAAGWSGHNSYIADGPDGGVMGFVSKHYFCVVEGRWDGGDDTDSLYVPAPGCSVTVVCVPRRADDVPR